MRGACATASGLSSAGGEADRHSTNAGAPLTREPTLAELALWKLLRGRGLAGLKFRRQVPIGPYIADFACYEAKLVVEADGGVHRLREDRDAERDAWLRAHGFTVLRLDNELIIGRPDLAVATIREASRRHPSSEPLRGPPSPTRGEG